MKKCCFSRYSSYILEKRTILKFDSVSFQICLGRFDLRKFCPGSKIFEVQKPLHAELGSGSLHVRRHSPCKVKLHYFKKKSLKWKYFMEKNNRQIIDFFQTILKKILRLGLSNYEM
jgi:hypothetical protein